jgi:PAS domain S-box-containing protein
MCINVIKGTTDPKLSFYTEGGSFYMNGTTRFLATVSEKEKGRTRNACNQAGYESVALVPIHSGDNILGLIHVADYQENMVPLEKVSVLEGAAMQLGAAIQRVRAGEALIEERHLLYTLMDNLPDKIYFKDRESRFTRMNKVHTRLFGLSDPAQAAGKTDFDFFTPEHAQEAYKDEQEIIRSGQPVVGKEEMETWPDGHVTWVSTTKMPLRDAGGNIIGTFGVSRDITERKRAEEALRDSEERFRGLVQNATVGIYRTTPQGRILMANPTLIKMLGYANFEELTALNLEEEGFAPGYSRRTFRELIERDGVVRGLESAWARRDGSMIFVRESARVARDESRNVLYYDGIVEDITDRRQLEQQLIQAQKMEAVGRLAGGVAHDFNNLLTIINGYAELLTKRSSPEDPRQRQFNEILMAGERAASLTGQLLAFGRRQVLNPIVVDLSSVLADTEEMLRRLIGEDVELVTTLRPDLGRVKVDPGQIEQVIMNLAVNARDAMPEGGKFLIETSNVEVDEDFARCHSNMAPGKYVMLAATDTGCGMDRETQARIFEPFFTTKGQGKGTGLGLAMVYGIVKQSGGFIWVSSEPGRGSTFEIYFPCLEVEERTAEPAKVLPKPPKGKETVLVVEDEGGVRSLVCETLASYGYKVLEAAGGAQALQIAEQHAEPIHLLLTDVVMPQISGKELAKRLFALHSETRVLYMSGYTDDVVVRQGILQGGAAFLQKPFSSDALLLKVRDVLKMNPGNQP